MVLAGVLVVLPLATETAHAGSGLSLIGLRGIERKLQRYLHVRPRRHKKRHKSAPAGKTKATTGVQEAPGSAATASPALAAPLAVPLAAAQAADEPPPLPVPNPLRLQRKLTERLSTAAPATTPNSKKKTARGKSRLLKRLRTVAVPEVEATLQANADVRPRAKTNTNTASTTDKTKPRSVKLPQAFNAPPLPTRRPFRPPSAIKTDMWTTDLVSKATEECKILLAGVTAQSRPLPPIRKGLCGAPAPRLVSEISGSAPIDFKPAATLSCPMVASLARWFHDDVQPLAKQYFNSEVKQLINVSSYVCRNRYGDTDTKISEHAFANALDVAGFVLQNGQQVRVLEDWSDDKDSKGAFLHALHKRACKYFGTVLGPEANAAHKDHFHLDMAPRRHSTDCR